MKCPKCEKENVNNINTCEFCGSEMFGEIDAQTLENEEAPKKKSKKKIIIAIIAVVVAIALAVIGVLVVLSEQEKQRQRDAKTDVTISEFSEEVKKLSVKKTEDGKIGEYSDDNEKYSVISDEYGNVREITMVVDINMEPGSYAYKRLMSLSSYELCYGDIGGLVADELIVSSFVLSVSTVYELCADVERRDDGIHGDSIDEVLSMVNEEKEVNDWVMFITYDDDSLTFKAEYVG